MAPHRGRPSGRRLLVASIGAATINYVAVDCGSTEVVGNFAFTPEDASLASDQASQDAAQLPQEVGDLFHDASDAGPDAGAEAGDDGPAAADGAGDG